MGPDTENPIEHAMGIGDMNGDGYDDIAILFRNYCNVYLGGDPFDLIPDFRFEGRYFYVPGDVNGDQYADLIIYYIKSAPNFFYSTINLYFGGATIDTIPDFIYNVDPNEGFYEFVDRIGDINKDGYDDFVLSGGYYLTDIGFTYLFLGGESINNKPDIIFRSPPKDEWYGRAISGIGDINKDGYDDFIISSISHDSSRFNCVYLYYGASILDTTIDRILVSVRDDHDYGHKICNAGDINGDNNSDFIISSHEYIDIYVDLDSVIVIDASKFGFGGYVSSAGGGDINNDGFNDFIIGNTNYINIKHEMVGAAFLFYGNPEINTIPDFTLEGQTLGTGFAKDISVVGDLNNDGYDDVIIIAPSFPDVDKSFGKLYLYSYKNFIINNLKTATDFFADDYCLMQNYPNPFNPVTMISYQLPKTSHVELSVYNLLGEKVIALVSEKQQPGQHQVKWDATGFPSGIYYYSLTAGEFKQVKKMVLVR